MDLSFSNRIKIEKVDPFANDALKRRESAEILTNLLQMCNQPMVLAINSSWGTGKTTFINMWRQYLENSGFNTLFFNAWENDFVDEPFIAFINEFEQLYGDKSSINKFKKISGDIIKGLIPAAVRLGTSGLLDLEKVKVSKEAEELVLNYSEKIADEQIKKYKATRNAMEKFKEVLAEFVQEKCGANSLPIIFFVDELDRCRPNFAIQLLEKIKHLFYINGLIFVLSIDKTQLANSVKVIYGNNMDTEGYLARLIDLEYKLPIADKEAFANFLFEKLNIKNVFERREVDNNYNIFKITTINLFSVFNFSLRIQEKILWRILIILNTFKKNELIYPEVLIFLVCLKFSSASLYEKICLEEISYTELISELQSKTLLKKYFYDIDNYGPVLDGMLLAILGNSEEFDRVEDELKKYKTKEKLSKDENKEFDRLNYKVEVSLSIRRRYIYNKNIIHYITKKIEICNHFVLE